MEKPSVKRFYAMIQRPKIKPLFLDDIVTAWITIWWVYDVLDMYCHGTTQQFIFGSLQNTIKQTILSTQLTSVIYAGFYLWGYRKPYNLFILCILRGLIAWLFPLNDFLYACMTLFSFALINQKDKACGWMHRFLLLQIGWMYTATAFLKINQPFLSGGHFYVRQQYLLNQINWPYPLLYQRWMEQLAFNRALALLTIFAELLLGACLLLFAFKPHFLSKKILLYLTWFLCGSIHITAILCCNVWLFGFCMMVHVWGLTTAHLKLTNAKSLPQAHAPHQQAP